MNRRNRALRPAFRHQSLWKDLTYEEPGDDLDYSIRQLKLGLNVMGDWRYPWRSVFVPRTVVSCPRNMFKLREM